MRPVSSATRAPDPQEAANGLLAQPAGRSTPASMTVLNVSNGPNELVRLASNGPDVEQVRALSAALLPQGKLQELRQNHLGASISFIGNMLEAIQKSNFVDFTSLRHYKARRYLKLMELAPPFLLLCKTLSNPEYIKRLLDNFELFKEDYGHVVYDGDEGKALLYCRGLLYYLIDYAEACHDLECHDVPDHDPECPDLLQQNKNERSVKKEKLIFKYQESILGALDLVSETNALPDELRQITFPLFMDIGSRVLQDDKLNILESLELWSFVSSMEHKAAATLLGKTTDVISALFKVADAREMTDELQLIVNLHPNPKRRASLLAQMVIGLKKYPLLLAYHPDKIKDILDLLPENGGGHLRLDETLGCLKALQDDPVGDDPARKRVESLVKRVVKSTRPLRADEAKALRDWMGSKFSTLENVAELTDLVLSE